MSRDDITAKELEWLEERYTPVEIPPCPVCGDELSVGSAGGGMPTVWVCSRLEEDPDNPDKLRNKEGRPWPDGFGHGSEHEHHKLSRFIDRRQGGDALVLKLISSYRHLSGWADAVDRVQFGAK
jgi:hypothetical protein